MVPRNTEVLEPPARPPRLIPLSPQILGPNQPSVRTKNFNPNVPSVWTLKKISKISKINLRTRAEAQSILLHQIPGNLCYRNLLEGRVCFVDHIILRRFDVQTGGETFPVKQTGIFNGPFFYTMAVLDAVGLRSG